VEEASIAEQETEERRNKTNSSRESEGNGNSRERETEERKNKTFSRSECNINSRIGK